MHFLAGKCSILNRSILFLGLFSTAVSTSAEMLLLSNEYGDPVNVFAYLSDSRRIEDQREWLSPATISGAAIAQEFVDLCVTTQFDRAKFDAAVVASPYTYAKSLVKLPPNGKNAAFALEQRKSESSFLTLWLGESAASLKGQPYLARTRGLMVTGGLDPKDLYAPQCNLSIRTSGLHSGQELSDTITKLLGAPASKLVLKEGFADGYWMQKTNDGQNSRVAFSIIDLKKDAQLVHLSNQILSSGSK